MEFSRRYFLKSAACITATAVLAGCGFKGEHPGRKDAFVTMETGPAQTSKIQESLKQAIALALKTERTLDETGFQQLLDSEALLTLSQKTEYSVNAQFALTQQEYVETLEQKIVVYHPELLPIAVPMTPEQVETVLIATYGVDQRQSVRGWNPARTVTIFLGDFNKILSDHKAYTTFRDTDKTEQKVAYSIVDRQEELRNPFISPLFTEYTQSLVPYNDVIQQETIANQMGAWVRMAQRGFFNTPINDLPNGTPTQLRGVVSAGTTNTIYTFPDQNTRQHFAKAFAGNSLYLCDNSC